MSVRKKFRKMITDLIRKALRTAPRQICNHFRPDGPCIGGRVLTTVTMKWWRRNAALSVSVRWSVPLPISLSFQLSWAYDILVAHGVALSST